MAPVLQCPDCGEKHPIARVPTSGAFPCQGCGRVLKVPEVVGQRAASPAGAAVPTPAPVVARVTDSPRPDPVRPVPVASAVVNPSAATADPTGTRAIPQVDGEALGALSRSSHRAAARLGPVPWWMRLLLWFIAVPLAFLLVFAVARAFSLFTTNQLSDLFLANDNSRFWPVARLLPFVALVTASFVQAGVYLIARVRGRRRGSAPSELSVPANRSRR
jgi:hypothetical protein